MAGRIVGIGHATLDFLGQVKRPPEEDTKTELLAASFQGGGPAATATVTAALLGARASFVGKVAGDEFGRLILLGLRGAGVDVERCIVDRARKMSPFSFIQVQAGGKRTVWYTYGDVEAMKAPEIDLGILGGADLLIIDGHHPDAQAAAAEYAREHNVKVLLDAGSIREGMGDLVPLCDILIASERFAAEIAPRGEVEDSLDEIVRMGPETVIVTLGAGGSVGQSGEVRITEPAFADFGDGAVVDTTGAGDVYHGAYAYAVVEGFPTPKAMHFASIAAGLSCRALGGRAGIPILTEILQRM